MKWIIFSKFCLAVIFGSLYLDKEHRENNKHNLLLNLHFPYLDIKLWECRITTTELNLNFYLEEIVVPR